MKRLLVLFFVLGIAAISQNSYAQAGAELLEQALAAAPVRTRDDASVIKWSADYTYTTIKDGTNQIVCYSRANERDRPPFAVQCTSMANLERVAQNRKFRADSTDRDGERALVAAAAQNGTRVRARIRLVLQIDEWSRPSKCPGSSGNRNAGGDHSTIWLP